MTKTEIFNRRLKNCYIKRVVPQLIIMLANAGIEKERIVLLSDDIQFLRYCIRYVTLKIAGVSYLDIFDLSEEIADTYDIPEGDISKLLLSPFFPAGELTDNDLILLKELYEEFYGPFTQKEMKDEMEYLFENARDVKASYTHLLRLGLIATSGGRSSVVDEFPSPFDPKKEEDLPEDGEWYIDDSLTLQFGKDPSQRGTLFELIQSMNEAEKKYQEEWWAPIEKENERLMNIFRKDLEELKKQSRDYYISDIWWFLDSYFYYETIPSVHDASKNITDFFRYYICKGTGHSEYLVKRMMSTIKRFYSVMYENGEVTEEELNSVISAIKRNRDMYIEAATDYEKRVEYFSF